MFWLVGPMACFRSSNTAPEHGQKAVRLCSAFEVTQLLGIISPVCMCVLYLADWRWLHGLGVWARVPCRPQAIQSLAIAIYVDGQLLGFSSIGVKLVPRESKNDRDLGNHASFFVILVQPPQFTFSPYS